MNEVRTANKFWKKNIQAIFILFFRMRNEFQVQKVLIKYLQQ
jgi:hypothetical protein